MFYPKNVSTTERIVRGVAGLAMVACGLIGMQASLLGWIVALSGVITLATGAFGFCLMCAMVGRPMPKSRGRKAEH